MENILGWLLMVMVVAIPALLVYGSVKLYRKHRADSIREEQARAERIKNATAQWKGQYVTPTKRSTSYTRSAPSSSSVTPPSSSSNDNLLTDLATLYVLNSALSHGSAKAEVDYDRGTISTSNSSSSDWGLDDSDSRKSVSSTFDTSSSSSDSWSSSSSDSGPSSDW